MYQALNCQNPASSYIALLIISFRRGRNTNAGTAGMNEWEWTRLMIDFRYNSYMSNLTAVTRTTEKYQISFVQFLAIAYLCALRKLWTGRMCKLYIFFLEDIRRKSGTIETNLWIHSSAPIRNTNIFHGPLYNIVAGCYLGRIVWSVGIAWKDYRKWQ